MLVQRLSRFRLRSQVRCAMLGDTPVHVAWDGAPARSPGPSPRPTRGCRRPDGGSSRRGLSRHECDEAAWDRHRLALGLPDGSRDLEAEKTVLLEAGFDELHGVSWTRAATWARS